MSSIVVNVAIGVPTSVVTGSLVWSWRRVEFLRRKGRYGAFFGLSGAGECAVVIGQQMNNPFGVQRSDVRALVEVASIANDGGTGFQIFQSDQFREGTGGRVEFCIGGPFANNRTAGHIATYLPGAGFTPYRRDQPDSIAIVAGGSEFVREPGLREFVIMARVFPSPGARPLFLIAGQTGVTNLAAAHYLRCRFEELRRAYGADRRFCLVLRLDRPDVYGHESVHLASDITATAFAS
ncbi:MULTISPECIES: hypothetical protein [Frankia]|nr:MULTISPECIES: hypothetical protein [Frankia]